MSPADVSARPEPPEPPDLAALRAHDPDAWEALYRRVHPRLVAYARGRVGSGPQAEDVVSEAVLRAMDAVERYRPGPAGVEGWMFGITRHVLQESHRAHARQQPAEPERMADLVGGTEDDAAAPLLAAEERHRVRRAFSRLSRSDREVLELRVVVGLDSQQVAEATGRRPGTVRVAQSRALARLRAELARSDRPEGRTDLGGVTP